MGRGEFRILEVLATDECVDRIARLDVEKVLYSPSLGVFGAFGNFIHLHFVNHSSLCEEEYVAVHRRGVDVLDEILFTGVAAARAYAATVLCAEFGQRGAFDVAHVRDSDNHLVVGIKIFGVEIACGIVDFGATRIAVGIAYLYQFALYKLAAHMLVVEYFLQVCDKLLDFLVVGM